MAVEKFDEDDPEAVIAEGAKQIADVAEQVHANRIMLYPYAHLSSNLSSPADRRQDPQGHGRDALRRLRSQARTLRMVQGIHP